jgi:ATP synthase protein I
MPGGRVDSGLVSPYGALALAGAKSPVATTSCQSSMTERKPPKSRDDLDKRLRQFRNKRDVATGRDRNTDSTNNGLGFAMRIGVELVAALVIGVGFGLFLDSWLDTKPWFMLGFFLLGAAAGMFNVYRVVQNQGGAVGYRQQDKPGPEMSKTDLDGD